MENAIRLNNFILWCKNWYNPINRKEDIFVTAKKVLTLDDYFYLKNNQNVMIVINNFIDDLLYKNPKIFNNQQLSISVLFNDIVKYKNLCQCSFEEAWLRVVKNLFAFNLTLSDIALKPPVYSRKTFKMGLVAPHDFGNTYTEQNRNVKKYFNK